MKTQQGFTYLAALFLLVMMGMTLAAVGIVWHAAQQREKERELLFIGNQFRKAIGLYYERTPGSAKRYPQKLEDLLQDSRYLAIQRYLRKIYTDPMTRQKQWGIMAGPEGGVMGVYSISEEAPLKVMNFDQVNSGFEGKTKYSEWKFVYEPAATSAKANPVFKK